jgi:hypothetical protein
LRGRFRPFPWLGISLFVSIGAGVSPAKLTRSTDAKRKGSCACSWSRAANNNAPLSPCRRARARAIRDRCVPRGQAERCDLLAAGGAVDSWSTDTELPGCSLAHACAARRARQGAVAAEGQLALHLHCAPDQLLRSD